jgi:hypothetical protein
MGSGPWRSFQRNGVRSTAFKLDARAKLISSIWTYRQKRPNPNLMTMAR